MSLGMLFVSGIVAGAFLFTNQKGSMPTAYAAPAVIQPQNATSVAAHGPVDPNAFSIKNVTLQGTSWSCISGKMVMHIETATVNAASKLGGTYTWRIEKQNAQESYTSSERTVTMRTNETSSVLGADEESGYFYSALDAKPGEIVRVHVTSPNSTYSAAFGIPDSATCPQ